MPFADPGAFPARSLFPPAGGVRVSVAEFPPGMGKTEARETGANADALDALLTTDGSADAPPPNPGPHATDTADIGVVISGEVWLELDDGAERRIGPGDIVFQMGTVHTWHNRTSEPCVVAMVVFGWGGRVRRCYFLLRHAELVSASTARRFPP